jgi:hypothetical protein
MNENNRARGHKKYSGTLQFIYTPKEKGPLNYTILNSAKLSWLYAIRSCRIYPQEYPGTHF